MATVYIPTLLQNLTGGRASVEAPGATVREVIEHLEQAWPGLRDRLVEQDRLRPNISVAVDGEVSPLGLLEHVSAASEVHFVAAIRGGAGSSYAKTEDIRNVLLVRCLDKETAEMQSASKQPPQCETER